MINKIIVFCTGFVALNAFVSKNDYGDFNAKLLTYSFEIGPKFKSIVTIDSNIEEFETRTSLFHRFTIKKHLEAVGLKVRFSSWNEALKKYTPSFNIAMDNICQKQLAKEFLALIPGLTEKCDVAPGIYNFTISDYNAFMHHFTPGKFFYGKYLTLTDVFVGKAGRVVRFNVSTTITPV